MTERDDLTAVRARATVRVPGKRQNWRRNGRQSRGPGLSMACRPATVGGRLVSWDGVDHAGLFGRAVVEDRVDAGWPPGC